MYYLTDDFGTGAGPKIFQQANLEETMSKFEGTPRQFWTQNCVAWAGN